ncbi:hypothetical protein [Halomicrobium salinisoli]|uniref:hypothetical protein n=1 Tax=Halomicrobium salinisoli TaxID=2878391 RepID=UPI001CEFDC28|nr:hypothetical protein [Halomicrobium salinisoli]
MTGPTATNAPFSVGTVRALARLWPATVDADPDLARSLGFLDWPVDAATVTSAAYGASLVVAATGTVLGGLLPGPGGLVAAAVSLALSTFVAVGGPALPGLLAAAKRSRALGAAPSLVTRATLRMRITPSPERAADFAADAGAGPLARSLRDHVRRARRGPGTGLAAFAREWDPWFPELRRACALVESAGRAAGERRERSLKRARSAVLEGARDRLSEFAAGIRGPVTALYAFGVLLPLALVSLLPAVRAAGLPASLPAVVIAYDVLLPAGLLAACGWLLAHRPVAFPPPSVDRSHPDVPSRRWPIPLAGIGGAAAAWLVAARLLPHWTPPLAAVGFGTGLALVAAYRPTVAVRERTRAVEAGLADAVALVGRRVRRGKSVERALPAVAEELPEETGAVLADAAARQRRLGIGVEAALDAAVADLPSRRVRAAAAAIALAADEGRPAGDALIATGEHLEAVTAVEREARRAVAQVTDTLSNTAAVFAPLVGGATVALADAFGADGPLVADANAAGLGAAVGVYVLLLAVLLTALATGLTRGFDRSLVGYRVGLALLAATATYLTALAGVGLAV